MDEKLKLLLEAATQNIPVLDDTTSDIFQCITYDFFSEDGALFGAGKAVEETASCQVDIWYQIKDIDVKETIKSVKNALKLEKTYSYPVTENNYDPANSMHHTYFTFKLIKESEE